MEFLVRLRRTTWISALVLGNWKSIPNEDDHEHETILVLPGDWIEPDRSVRRRSARADLAR
jgi:hypothetical protein